MAHNSTYSDSDRDPLGHIRTFELVNQGIIPIKMELTVYEQKAIAVVDTLLDLFGKHQNSTTFWDLDIFHRRLWFSRAQQILSALGINERG